MIQSISAQALEAGLVRPAQASPDTGSPFASLLQDALQNVSETAADAARQSVGLITGETGSVHAVVLAAEKADLALRLTLQLRNKALDAYNEIMRMQI